MLCHVFVLIFLFDVIKKGFFSLSKKKKKNPVRLISAPKYFVKLSLRMWSFFCLDTQWTSGLIRANLTFCLNPQTIIFCTEDNNACMFVYFSKHLMSCVLQQFCLKHLQKHLSVIKLRHDTNCQLPSLWNNCKVSVKCSKK